MYKRQVLDTDYALLPSQDAACVIEIQKDRANITNGKLKAAVELASSGWRKDHGKITFYRQDGSILFEDIDPVSYTHLDVYKRQA